MNPEPSRLGAGRVLAHRLFAHRLSALLPALASFALLPLPDRPWPASLVILAILSLSRIPVSLEGLRDGDDLVTTMPFLLLALVAAAWHSLSGGASLALLAMEALFGCILAAVCLGFLPRRIGPLWQALCGLGLFALEAMAWAWAEGVGREALVIAAEALASILALWLRAGTRP